MLESSESQTPNEVRSGNFAKVEMREDEVIVEPRSRLPSAIESLNVKMDKQQMFNEMFSNFEGIKVCQIKESDDITGRYVVERAQGLNLSNVSGERDGNIENFLSLSTDMKTKGVLIYLRMLKELNTKNYSFQDHKGDSIFLQGDNTNKTCKLSIIDAGSLTKNNNPQESWEAELRGGLKETIKSFFTRGTDMKEMESLIPRGIRTILERIDQYPNADALLSDIRGYVRGGKSIDKFDYHERKNDILKNLGYIKDQKFRNIVEGKDFSQLPQYEIDRWETFGNAMIIEENKHLMNALRRR